MGKFNISGKRVVIYLTSNEYFFGKKANQNSKKKVKVEFSWFVL